MGAGSPSVLVGEWPFVSWLRALMHSVPWLRGSTVVSGLVGVRWRGSIQQDMGGMNMGFLTNSSVSEASAINIEALGFLWKHGGDPGQDPNPRPDEFLVLCLQVNAVSVFAPTPCCFCDNWGLYKYCCRALFVVDPTLSCASLGSTLSCEFTGLTLSCVFMGLTLSCKSAGSTLSCICGG